MIGHNHIGKNGRFGNQMFQYAATRGIASNQQVDFIIPDGPKSDDEFNDEENQHKLFMAFNMTGAKNIGLLEAPYRKEASFRFDCELFENCDDNLNLYGYFQSEEYFTHIEDEIREDFTFKDEILNPCKEMIQSVDNPIALHVRRTDYVTNSANHPPCTLEYYEEALKHFDDDRNVIVFSDDPAWCNEQELFSDDRFLISENDDNRVDLCLMTLCSDFIIANSSFSWWGAWLANRGKVVAPVRWFGTDGYTKDHDTKDVVPDGWTRI